MGHYHIDLFMPRLSRYHVLHNFTSKLCEALKRQGQNCKLHTVAKEQEASFFTALAANPRDFTLTFNSIPPSDEGIFLWDMLKIPHLSILVDSPAMFFQTIRGSVDKLLQTHF